jgi:cytochrome c
MRFRVGVTLAGLGLCAGGASAAAYALQPQSELIARTLTGGDPGRAPAVMRRYGCAGCHTIPGIPGADGQVGGPLGGLKQRVYIGGVATHTPDHLIRWIVAPQSFSPRSAMPATGIDEREARDVAAYLYAH